MTKLARRVLAGGSLGLLLLAAGCGGEDAGALSPDNGGNVGFGGAQDIGLFRDILERGDIPGENTLDANGFFSEHYAELPPPDCGQTLCAHAMLAMSRDWVRWKPQRVLQVALNTPLGPDDVAEQPLDVVVVVDTSGSMLSDQRLDKVKEGLHLLVDGLGPDDRMGLVRYSSTASVARDLAPVTLDLHEDIDALVPSGSTFISGGLETGFGLFGPYESGRQRRLILLSDGLANVGLTNPDDFYALAAPQVERGIGITTVGVGTDFNVDLMRGLAEQGSGNFYFAEDSTAVTEVFTQELDFFSAPIAFQVRVEVLASAGYDLGEVIGTKLSAGSSAQRIIDVPAVFLASRHSDDPGPEGRRGGGSALFLELEPRNGAVGGETAATLAVTYLLPSGERIEQLVEVEMPEQPGTDPSADYFSQEFMREHYGMYNMFVGLREATRLAAYDYTCASAVLHRLRDNAVEWNEFVGDEDIAADLLLVDLFIANLDQRGGGTARDWEYCEAELTPVGDDYVDYDHVHHCSAASGMGGAGPMSILAAALVLRRRRRGSRK